jgi:hypothetical protein
VNGNILPKIMETYTFSIAKIAKLSYSSHCYGMGVGASNIKHTQNFNLFMA